MPSQGPFRDGSAASLHLIETMRWEPGAGFVRGERHFARMARSAAALGLRFDQGSVEEALRVATGSEPLRVRLSLAPDGHPSVTTHPFSPLAAGSRWTVRIAAMRLSSADPLLRHKTSRRAVYDAARAEVPPTEADEMLLLNERGECCEGTITSLFADLGDGRLATPPLECGLLAGILREELLETGQAYERLLTPSDLAQATAVFVGNSLRGLIAARLVG